jgi:GNAT superfamily N-acetyltransferase
VKVDISPAVEEIEGGYTFRLGNSILDHDRLRKLHILHFKEIENVRDPFLQPDFDYPRWIKMEEQGTFKLFVMAHNGELVGNMGLHLQAHPYHGKIVAAEEFLFVMKEHRRGFLALHFIRWVMARLKEAGVHEIISGTTTTRNVSVMYRRLGYNLRTLVFSKVL